MEIFDFLSKLLLFFQLMLLFVKKITIILALCEICRCVRMIYALKMSTFTAMSRKGLLHILIGGLFALLLLQAKAQSTEQLLRQDVKRAGGIFMSRVMEETPQTPVPHAYRICYLSHYGRHGSRYHSTAIPVYTKLPAIFADAAQRSILTPDGEKARERIELLSREAQGREGTLTSKGLWQLDRLGALMSERYPELFSPGSRIRAIASHVGRTQQSRDTFLDGVRRNASGVEFLVSNTIHDDSVTCSAFGYMAVRGVSMKAFQNLRLRETPSVSRILGALFTDPAAARTILEKHLGQAYGIEFMRLMHMMAANVQSTDNPEADLFFVFTPEEILSNWKLDNAVRYWWYSLCPEWGVFRAVDGRLVLRDIVAQADRDLSQESGCTVSLRFGHDSHLMPVVAMLGLEGCRADVPVSHIDSLHSQWRDFQITPMAASMEILFYRNPRGHVIVKFLLNGSEQRLALQSPMAPYYDWAEVRKWMLSL